MPEDASTTAAGSALVQPARLLALWEGHQTAADLQAGIDAQRAEAHKYKLQQRAVMREIKAAKRKQVKIRAKTTKLTTQDLLRELEYRAEHKAAVEALAAEQSTTGSSSSSSSGKPPRVHVRRGIC